MAMGSAQANMGMDMNMMGGGMMGGGMMGGGFMYWEIDWFIYVL